MPSYETLCIFHPELPDTRVKELTTWMQTIVENGQGNVLKVEPWGMRDLSYPIKKQRRGYYVRLEYDSDPAALNELERNLRLSEEVLRFLSVVRGAPIPATPSPVAAPAPEPAPVETEPEAQ